MMRAGVVIASLLLVVPACRKPAPREIVFTPGLAADGVEPAPSTGVGPSAGPSRPQPAAPAGGGSSTEPPPPSGGGGGANTGGADGEDVCAAAGPADTVFSKQALLGAAADCAVKHYCAFGASIEPAVMTAAASAADPANAELLVAAQQAYRVAAASWQRAEAFRFGPAARSSEPGGRDLRDLIYAWPLRPECKVDEQLVAQAYAQPSFASRDFQASPLTGRTLSALEYLLFRASASNSCSAFSSINADGTWAALSSAERQVRRAAYAAATARDIRAQTAELLASWSGPRGFRAQLTAAGEAGSVFPSQQAALNAVSDALFYIDLEVKDLKLARPLGLTPDCPNSVCPADVESPHARLSAEHLQQNLAGIASLFEGCGEGQSGLGFDDWLRDAGAPDLAERMSVALSRAREAAIALTRPLEELLTTEPGTVLAAHTAVKGFTDLLKTEFVTVLNLELPTATEGDND